MLLFVGFIILVKRYKLKSYPGIASFKILDGFILMDGLKQLEMIVLIS